MKHITFKNNKNIHTYNKSTGYKGRTNLFHSVKNERNFKRDSNDTLRRYYDETGKPSGSRNTNIVDAEMYFEEKKERAEKRKNTLKKATGLASRQLNITPKLFNRAKTSFQPTYVRQPKKEHRKKTRKQY
jgi:hypothetical protein